jgi:dienelactone hydrolase
MDTVFNGKIAEDFKKKPMIPLIYLHGVCSNRTIHSGTCRDLASHGYIVFTMDHRDGSSTYVTDKDGTNERYYESQKLHYDLEYKKYQL